MKSLSQLIWTVPSSSLMCLCGCHWVPGSLGSFSCPLAFLPINAMIQLGIILPPAFSQHLCIPSLGLLLLQSTLYLSDLSTYLRAPLIYLLPEIVAVSHTSEFFFSGFFELEVHDLFVCMLPVKQDISKANTSLPPAINPYYASLYNSVQKQKYWCNQYYWCHSLMVYLLQTRACPFRENIPF